MSPVKRTVGFAVLQQLLHHTLPLQITADLIAGRQRCRITCAQSLDAKKTGTSNLNSDPRFMI